MKQMAAPSAGRIGRQPYRAAPQVWRKRLPGRCHTQLPAGCHQFTGWWPTPGADPATTAQSARASNMKPRAYLKPTYIGAALLLAFHWLNISLE